MYKLFLLFKDFFKDLTFKEIALFLAFIGTASKWMEDIFNKKYLGNIIFGYVGKFFMFFPKMMTNQKQMLFAISELNLNLTTAKEQTLKNGIKLNDIFFSLELSEEIDEKIKFKVNNTGACIYANRSFFKTFGFTENDVFNFNWERYIKSEDFNRCKEKWKRAIETQSEFLDIHTIYDNFGRANLCEVRGLPILSNGIFTGFYGVIKVLSFTLKTN